MHNFTISANVLNADYLDFNLHLMLLAFLTNHSRISVVDVFSITVSPGPMMVYALTLNVIIVLGGRYLSVCCVADVLV